MVNPLDPNGLIAPLQQSSGAQLAGYNSAIQNTIAKNVLGASRPVDMQAALSYPSSPSLQFSPNPTFAQGVGEGIGNFMALRNYRTRTEMLNDAVLRQREKEKQQMDMLKAAEEAKQHNETLQMGVIREKYPGLADAYAYGSREQRDAIWKDIGGYSSAPYAGDSEGQKKIAEHDALVAAIQKIGPLETRNAQGEMVPNPAAIRAYSELLGKTPYLTLDANKDYIETQQANVNLKSSQNELGAQPGKLKREALSETLGIKKEQVEAKYAEALAFADKLTAENKLEEANRLKKDLADGRKRYDSLVQLYDSLTPGQIKLYNSQFKSMSLPYELPEKAENKKTPIKHKGIVTGFTDSEGNVYDAHGKLKN